MKDLDLDSISVSEGLAKLADWLADLAGERLSEDSSAAYYALAAAEIARLAGEAEEHQALMNCRKVLRAEQFRVEPLAVGGGAAAIYVKDRECSENPVRHGLNS